MLLASKARVSSALLAMAIACGGPDRPAENPTQGPSTGGQGTDVLPLPEPAPVPGSEPPPGPGGPDTTPSGTNPGQFGVPGAPTKTELRDLRSPLIGLSPFAARRPIESAVGGSGAVSGRPGVTKGGSSFGGGPGVGGTDGQRR